MRIGLALVVLVGLPALAAAQTSVAPPPPAGPLPPIGLPLPPIGLPLPSIGLPLPAIGLPPAQDMRPQTPSQPDEPPRHDRRRGETIFFVPTFPWTYPGPGMISTPAPAAPAVTPGAVQPDAIPSTGTLQLDVQPAGVQLFVDGYYIGTPEDFNNQLTLEAGAHSIELRLRGYDTLTVPTKIAAGQSITYRATMKRAAPEPPAPPPAPSRPPSASRPEPPAVPPPAPAASTFYFIPGCYMGNVPPDQVALPPGCDLSKLITRKP